MTDASDALQAIVQRFAREYHADEGLVQDVMDRWPVIERMVWDEAAQDALQTLAGDYE